MDLGMERAAKIAIGNDVFRRCALRFTMTAGIQRLGDLPGLIEAVRDFDKFTEDNDPYREHDFGSLTWRGEEVFWKIDYYDRNLKYGSDPLDRHCKRVLTVMLASEY